MMTTVDRMLRDRATITPNRVAIEFGDERVSYAELDRRSDELARSLGHGERVATLTGNTPEHVVVFFACAKAGAILVPLSWRLTPYELAYQLDDAEPAVFLVEQRHAELAEAALALASVSPASEPAGGQPRTPAPDDPLLLIYTSGTSGRPKGALLTHANCFWTNLSFDLATGISGSDVVLQTLPQFHCGGWNVQPLLAWWKGATVVLERSFDAGRALALISGRGITTMMGVPAHYLFISQVAGFAEADLSSLRSVVVGGAPVPLPLLDTWSARGVDIVQGYGLTEASPNVLVLPPEDARRKAGSAGKPYPYVECELSDGGELLVRGPNVFAGYWRNPEATGQALAGGWLHTGDIAARDDEGFFQIRGRLKELIISGGENIYPAEVEEALASHPAVIEAAVVGMPDERWGEVCAAFVVLREPVEEPELTAFCRERLAAFKVPRSFSFVESLPRNSIGKIQKSELRVHA
jgi:fatty-acyl-CoA synthase